MAERIVSPGVFTREKDLSFLPQGVAEIGAAVIGTTQKGPAFWPTQVTSYTEFESKFGGLEQFPTTYVPHTVREYFEQGGNVMTVVRVLSSDDVTITKPLTLKLTNTLHQPDAAAITDTLLSNGVKQNVVAVLYPTEHEVTTQEISLGEGSYLLQANVSGAFGLNTAGPTGNGDVSASFRDFVLHLSGSGKISAGGSVVAKVSGSGDGTGTPTGFLNGISASLLATDSDSIDTVLGTSHNSNKEAFVKYYNTNFSSNSAVSSSAIEIDATSHVFSGGYKGAQTPFITNQYTGSAQTNLFKIHHLGHGESTNYELKLAILNMKPANGGTDTKYATFDLQVRTIKQTGLPFATPYAYDADDDNSANVIEEFTGLTLDPRDANYISRRIGDRYYKINSEGKVIGVNTYPNQSRFIRVEVTDAVKTQGIPNTDAPFGYQAVTQYVPNTNDTYTPSASIVTIQQETEGIYEPGVFYGFNFDFVTTDNVNYLAPIPSTAASVGANVDFNLCNMKGHVSASDSLTGNLADDKEYITMTGATHQLQRRFMVPFQGGQDGKHPSKVALVGKSLKQSNSFGLDFTDSTTDGTKAYKKAINALGNQDEFDINLLTMPGIITDFAPSVITHAINKTEQRGDCFLIFDIAKYNDSPTQTVSTIIADAVTDAANYDSSYAASYFPWLMYNDAVNNVVTPLPPSAVMPSVFAGNDAASEPWFAPAGLNRGLLTAITEATTRLTHGERDTLYEGRINPIATFPNQGVCVWGQKTLQKKRSALDRINVRRLLIALKKFIASTSRFLVFEQNTAATRNRFLGVVNPYLESVQQRSGLHAFKVVMDDTNNTPDVVDRNRLVGNIMIQPTRTAEFIVLDFTVLPTGAVFPE